MKEALVIILFDHPLEHTTDYARKTSELLALENTVITVLSKDAQSVKEILVSGLPFRFWKKTGVNQFQLTPLFILPFRRFAWVVRVNFLINYVFVRIAADIIVRQNKIKEKYLWIFNPGNSDVLGVMGRSYFSLYDCVDYHGEPAQYQQEHVLIRQANLVVVNSHILYDTHRKYREDIILVPQGFRLDDFQVLKNAHIRITRHQRPVIGYIGGINNRLDYPLLLRLIEKTPQYQYVFVGPVQKHDITHFTEHVKPYIVRLFSFPNVHHEEEIPKEEVPSVISRFDIAMIPYNTDMPFNRYCYPTKLFEYFYMGKPVLSTPIDELRRFPKFVKIGRTAAEWGNHINKTLSKPWSIRFQKEQKKLAVGNSWARKIRVVMKYINPTD